MRLFLWITPFAALALALLTWTFATSIGQTPAEQLAGGCSSCDARHQYRIMKRDKGKEALSSKAFPIQNE